jgi:CrcB protein
MAPTGTAWGAKPEGAELPARSADGEPRSEVALRLVAIAAGGAGGTLARYGVERALTVPANHFPWATFLVNVAGSFLLGAIVTLAVERWPPTRFVRPFAAIGFCGGFTTFSTMVVEAVQRGQHGHLALAGGYLGASLVAGVAAAAFGMVVARVQLVQPEGGPIPDPDDIGALRTRDPGRDRGSER